MQLTTVPGRQTGEASQGRRSWLRLISAGGAALVVTAASVALTAPAQGLDMSNVGGPDATGFPSFYTDDAGLALQLCVDGTARCGGATATDDGAGGPGVSVAPDGEGFYWMATATLNSPRGTIDIEFAHEAAWATATQRLVFDRTRVRGDLRPGNYTLLTPYGRTKLSAVGTGQRNVNLTQDLNCAQAANGPCAKKMTNWLRSVNAPVGYLGNAATPTRVTGGTERNNLVLLAPNGSVIGRTNRFVVQGKLADGPAALLSGDSVDFGNSKSPVKRSITVKNQGTAALTLQGIRVAGAKTIKLARTGCVGRASLASGASCKVNMTYRPGARDVSSGRLLINDNSVAGSHQLPVQAMTASLVKAPGKVSFKRTQVRSVSHKRRILVENTGVVPLKIQAVGLRNARNFERTSGQGPLCAKGATVRPGKACAVYVAFSPKTFGVKNGAVVVKSNAANDPGVINLTGRGH